MLKKTIFEEKYFYMDAAVFGQNLSANGILVYSYLCKCANKSGESWPSHGTIAWACSIAVTTVKQALKELENRGMVTVIHRYRAEGGKTSNLYRISKTFGRVCAVGAKIFSVSVSSKAKLVYVNLCKCADKEGKSWPSHRTIAQWCDMGISTVRKALQELAGAAIVRIEERRRQDNGQSSNLYKVLQIAQESLRERFRGFFWTVDPQVDETDCVAATDTVLCDCDSQIIAGGMGVIEQGGAIMRL